MRSGDVRAADDDVELAGRQVKLREFRTSDLRSLSSIVGDERVTRTLAFDAMGPQETRAMLTSAKELAAARPRREYYLAVALLDDDDVIGFVRLGLGGVQAAKLGYAIGAEHWGRGYATDAAGVVLRLAFVSLGLHRVTAAIGPDNAGSIAVAHRLGFVKEGRLREHVFTNGAWRDSLLYSLLAHEWDATR